MSNPDDKDWLSEVLEQNIQVSRWGNATDPKPDDKVWFTTQMQELWVVDFTAAKAAIESHYAKELQKAVRKALDLYQKDIKGWDINAYRAEGLKTSEALIHVADRSREYVDAQLNKEGK